jgi:predicted secreted protein
VTLRPRLLFEPLQLSNYKPFDLKRVATMQFLSAFAVYFVIWWIVLFTVLPLGMRSQHEEGEVTLGTVESAPARFRGGRVVLLTTLISAIVYGAWYVASTYFGFSMATLPRIVPSFD